MSVPKDSLGNDLAVGDFVMAQFANTWVLSRVAEIKEPSQILEAGQLSKRVQPGRVVIIVQLNVDYPPNVRGISGIVKCQRPSTEMAMPPTEEELNKIPPKAN